MQHGCHRLFLWRRFSGSMCKGTFGSTVKNFNAVVETLSSLCAKNDAAQGGRGGVCSLEPCGFPGFGSLKHRRRRLRDLYINCDVNPRVVSLPSRPREISKTLFYESVQCCQDVTIFQFVPFRAEQSSADDILAVYIFSAFVLHQTSFR
jgi:hypothetical protein